MLKCADDITRRPPSSSHPGVTVTTTAIAISERILWIREQRVLLDGDLAKLYGVSTGNLIQSVKRNIERFPADFTFQLAENEWATLRSQIVISNSGRGGRRYAPYAFTEQGIAMLSSVLKSPQAIAVNIEIMRTFVKLRAAMQSKNIRSAS